MCFFLSFRTCYSSIDHQTFYILLSRFYTIPHLSSFPGIHTSMLSPLWMGRQLILLLVEHGKPLLQLCSLVLPSCDWAPFMPSLCLHILMNHWLSWEAHMVRNRRQPPANSQRESPALSSTGHQQLNPANKSSELSTDSSIQAVR